ncbi:MAG: ABC transporter substrate-binding protein [Rhodospirillaceae bacterium]|nr:ABC transporter substrate-binding protein [Rhodospirillaceae bacterium]
MYRTRLAAAALTAAALLAPAASHAADEVRIGMVTTLSGPGSGLGIDIRDGFMLAITQRDGTLGGLPVEVVEGDDTREPDVARTLVQRMIERDRVDIITGIVWSNLALAVMPTIARNEVFFISANAGPSALAGEQCNPWFFNVAYQNDNNHEAMGQAMSDMGFATAVILAPNYPAGQDSLTGFQRYYTGEVLEEIYTQLGQLDYAAEIARIRDAAPEAVFFFYPGGMGIHFIQQYVQAGLDDTIPFFGPAFSFDQTILAAVGDAALGVSNTAQWSPDLDNPANAEFVEDFIAAYGRIPSLYAAQGYDAALLIDSAVAAVDGAVEDRDAFRSALEAAEFASVRGEFRFNTNHFPIQNFYLREVVRNDAGELTNRIVGTVFEDHGDAYAEACSM